MNLEVYDVSNDDVRLIPKFREFVTPNLEVKHLDSTVTEAELMNFH